MRCGYTPQEGVLTTHAEPKNQTLQCTRYEGDSLRPLKGDWKLPYIQSCGFLCCALLYSFKTSDLVFLYIYFAVSPLTGCVLILWLWFLIQLLKFHWSVIRLFNDNISTMHIYSDECDRDMIIAGGWKTSQKDGVVAYSQTDLQSRVFAYRLRKTPENFQYSW
jgi:hypothetical protein